MRCEEVRMRLGALLDGEAGSGLGQDLEAHLDACQECGKEMAALRALGDLILGLAEPAVPVDLEASILEVSLRARPGVHGPSRRWAGALRIAAALLVALAGAYLGARSMRPPASPSGGAAPAAAGSVESLYEGSFALLPEGSAGAAVLALYQEEGR